MSLNLDALSNYFDWLQERGLPYPAVYSAKDLAPDQAKEPSSAIHSQESSKIDLSLSESPSHEASIHFVIVSQQELTEAERAMVNKIALALQFKDHQVQLLVGTAQLQSLANYSKAKVLALGTAMGQHLLAEPQRVSIHGLQETSFAQPMLTIPHPRDMLREPSLKLGAWAALQIWKQK